MLGQLIGAAGSILGGLLGGDSSTKTKEKTRSRTHSTSVNRANLGQMVKQAEKYGFNPLTVLQAGGLGAFSKTTGDSFTKSKSRGSGQSSSSGPLGAAIAGAAQSIGGAMQTEGNNPAQTAADAWFGPPTSASSYAAARQQEYDLVQAQLRDANWTGGGPENFGGVPTVPTSNLALQEKPPLEIKSDAKPKQSNIAYDATQGLKSGDPKVEQTTVTNPAPKSWGWERAPGAVDGEAFTTAYGDGGGDFIGFMATVPADIGYNARRLYDHYYPDNTMPGYTGKKRPDAASEPWSVLPEVLESVTMDDARRVQGLPPLDIKSNAAEAQRRRQYMQMNAAGATTW